LNHNVSKRFGDRQLFAGVEMEINGGDKIGLILGLSAIAVALFLLPRSPGFTTILLLLFLLGMGGGIVVTGANSLANSVSVAGTLTASTTTGAGLPAALTDAWPRNAAEIAASSMSAGFKSCATPRKVFMVRSPSGVTMM